MTNVVKPSALFAMRLPARRCVVGGGLPVQVAVVWRRPTTCSRDALCAHSGPAQSARRGRVRRRGALFRRHGRRAAPQPGELGAGDRISRRGRLAPDDRKDDQSRLGGPMGVSQETHSEQAPYGRRRSPRERGDAYAIRAGNAARAGPRQPQIRLAERPALAKAQGPQPSSLGCAERHTRLGPRDTYFAAEPALCMTLFLSA